jgi:hypothetical protein
MIHITFFCLHLKKLLSVNKNNFKEAYRFLKEEEMRKEYNCPVEKDG